jgi:hypothetical protein
MNPSPTWFICNLHQLLWLRLYRPALRSPIHHALYLIFFKLEIYLVYLQIVAHHSLQGYYLLFIPTFLQAFNALEITLSKRALYDMFLCLLLLTWMAQGKAAFSRIVHALSDEKTSDAYRRVGRPCVSLRVAKRPFLSSPWDIAISVTALRCSSWFAKRLLSESSVAHRSSEKKLARSHNFAQRGIVAAYAFNISHPFLCVCYASSVLHVR